MKFILGAWKVRGRCTGCGEVCGRCGRCMEGARKVRGRCNAYDLIGCGGDP